MSGSFIYFCGVITGAALVCFHQLSCNKAVNQCKQRYVKRNKKLKAENERLERTCAYYQTERAIGVTYKRGYDDGRRCHYPESQGFAIACKSKSAFFHDQDCTVK